MEQDLYNIGIIGGGPAGSACAYMLSKKADLTDKNIQITLIDSREPMSTILPTGGGRCNLAHAEYDFKELAKNYPRGEKFLYSVFSRFGTAETLELFDELGIKTYAQENGRIFPQSNDSKEVREKFLKKLKSSKNIIIKKETALRTEPQPCGFKVVTDMNSYRFNKLIYAVGGHSGYDMIRRLNVTVTEPKPALCALVTKEDFSGLMGTSLKNVYNHDTAEYGDILFTHFGISGPLIYTISSIKARDEFPYTLNFDLYKESGDFQDILNKNPHKTIKNVLSDYLPGRFCEFLLTKTGISPDRKAHSINGKERDLITESLHNFKTEVKNSKKDGETVTAGGVDLDKINPKTMESKEISGLYFCGEVINVDGFCGGFNLQNCWSTAWIVSESVI